MVNHAVSGIFYHCKWCGKSLKELAVSDKMECEGHAGITHIEYLKAKTKFYEKFGVVVGFDGKIEKEMK